MIATSYFSHLGLEQPGTLRITFYVLSTSYVEIILVATISRVSSYPDVGVIPDESILSRSHKFADVDPALTLDSCSATKNEQKNTQNNVIRVKIITFCT